MSKSKKKRKKSFNNKICEKKKSNRKIIIIISVLVIAVITAAIIIFLVLFSNNNAKGITGKSWVSKKAYTASGDEAELADIYNNRYTDYEGSLQFTDDGRFEIGLTPGDPDDGTHKGTYTYENGKISVTYDNEETARFDVVCFQNGDVEYISVPYADDYGSYMVYFYPV